MPHQNRIFNIFAQFFDLVDVFGLNCTENFFVERNIIGINRQTVQNLIITNPVDNRKRRSRRIGGFSKQKQDCKARKQNFLQQFYKPERYRPKTVISSASGFYLHKRFETAP